MFIALGFYLELSCSTRYLGYSFFNLKRSGGLCFKLNKEESTQLFIFCYISDLVIMSSLVVDESLIK